MRRLGPSGFHYFYRLGPPPSGASTDLAGGAALVLHAVSFASGRRRLILLAQEGVSLSRLGALARTSGAEGAA